ncbi:hypothetical protein [Micromonospora sp. NPDC049645]|uniref:hypothetical protein n=1 Tax=Micromonospora sp. NPDC049645 TaxID=3155508 RepID=UPI003432E54F
MGCGCGGSKSSSSTAAAQQDSTAGAGAGAYVWRATYTNGDTQDFYSEPEVLAALAHQGGGFRVVPRGS